MPIIFRPINQNNYSDARTDISINILPKIIPVINVKPTASDVIIYLPISNSTLTGGSAIDPDTSIVVNGYFSFTNEYNTYDTIGTYNETVTFSPNDQSIYLETTTDISLNIISVDLSFNVTATNIMLSQSLENHSIIDGLAYEPLTLNPVSGSFSFFSNDDPTQLGNFIAQVKFIPNDQSNYNEYYLINVNVLVEPLSPASMNFPLNTLANFIIIDQDATQQLNFNYNPYTIEWQQYEIDQNQLPVICNYEDFSIYWNRNENDDPSIVSLYYYYGDSNDNFELARVNASNFVSKWLHVAITRDNDYQVRCFINGTLQNEIFTSYNDPTTYNETGFCLGNQLATTYDMLNEDPLIPLYQYSGLMYGFCWTVGNARYTENFTGPFTLPDPYTTQLCLTGDTFAGSIAQYLQNTKVLYSKTLPSYTLSNQVIDQPTLTAALMDATINDIQVMNNISLEDGYNILYTRNIKKTVVCGQPYSVIITHV